MPPIVHVVAAVILTLAGGISACLSDRDRPNTTLEWIGGVLIVAGLAVIGAGLAPLIRGP
jgi:hypothetical protein